MLHLLSAIGDLRPRLAVVLGSGLGAVPHGFVEAASVSFGEVTGLHAPSVHGHSGRIAVGTVGGSPLLVFRGRLHYYEGHTWEHVAGPVERAAEWGIKTLLLTNAAGGIRGDLDPADLMPLSGHLFLQRRQSPEARGRRESPYSPRLLDLLGEIDPGLLPGIYAAVTGPCYETPAEIRALRSMGADAVGMSTAFEAMTAVRLGMEVAAISSITNKAAGLVPGTLNHAEVLANAHKPAERLSHIVADLASRV